MNGWMTSTREGIELTINLDHVVYLEPGNGGHTVLHLARPTLPGGLDYLVLDEPYAAIVQALDETGGAP